MSNVNINSLTKAKGLENVGATCYMNAVLQCFYHVRPLSTEFVNYNFHPNMIQQIPMTMAYLDVVKELSNNKGTAARPILFKNIISMNPLFTGVQANDSKDLILYFLEKIDSELTMLKYFTQNKNLMNTIRYMNNILSKQPPELQYAINMFMNYHNSIFADLFYGFSSQTIECSNQNCHQRLTNYQIFNFIIFPIENVYNSLKGKNNNNYYEEDKKHISPSNMRPAGKPSYSTTSNSEYGKWYNDTSKKSYSNNYYNRNDYGKKSVTLIDCFENEINTIEFKGDNQIYCNRCNKLLDAKGENRIFSSPHVLILILNRGKANKFDCDVEFEESLNIEKYVESKQCPTKYKLIGVISHFGESSMSGHFIADCRHFDGKWYTFNDSIVTGPNFKYSKKGTPYILFYENENYV